jgi:hypothetical protein
MKAIINNKLYDTEKCEVVYEFRINYPYKSFFNSNSYINDWNNVQYLKTKKGNYILHNTDKNMIEEVSLFEVKKTISQLDPNKYIELFGEVEEG